MMCKFIAKLKIPKYNKICRYALMTLVIIGLYLLFFTDMALAAGMDDDKIKEMVTKKLGAGSVGQSVMGGAGLVTSGIMAYSGQLKMAVITLLSTGGILTAYNSGILF